MTKLAPTAMKFGINILVVLFVLFLNSALHAQIGINVPANESPQAQLDIRQGANNLPGMLIPKVSSLPQASAGETIAEGLMVFLQGENPNFYVFVNGSWQTIAESSGVDITPPSVPLNLTASNPTGSTIDLNWDASTDNSGVVAGYKIYRSDGTLQINVTSGLSATISGLSSNTSYTFYATAYDAAGNESGASNNASETTTQPCLVVGDYDSTHQGVVFWVNPSDCSNYKIISMNNIAYNSNETLKYSKDTDESGQESDSDGYGNNLNWIQDFDTARNYRSDVTNNDDDIRDTALFAAFNYYGGSTNGWYLGAPAEWDEVYDNKSNINASLNSNSGTSLNEGGDRYWTSKQKDDDEAYTFKMTNSQISDRDKDEGHYIRSFLEINGTRTVKIGDLKNGGIVTYISSNSSYKIFALEQLAGKRWGWSGHNCGHSQSDDGYVNTMSWINNSNHQGRGDYQNTAFYTSYTYRTDGGSGHDGWYLPAPAELWGIKASFQLLNQVLTDAGATNIIMEEHWTSKYQSNRQASHMYLAWKNPYPTNKNNAGLRVRPMKQIN